MTTTSITVQESQRLKIPRKCMLLLQAEHNLEIRPCTATWM